VSIAVTPNVRYMIVCDHVLKEETRSGKLTIVGLTSLVVWPAEATTPVSLEQLVVLLILTDGRGIGLGRILFVNEETGLPVFGTPARRISFEGKDPTGHYGVTFALRDCRFPEPGVYSVQFLFNEMVLSQQLITVR
jgi:hypothetical protein